jgi:hypothetical protein
MSLAAVVFACLEKPISIFHLACRSPYRLFCFDFLFLYLYCYKRSNAYTNISEFFRFLSLSIPTFHFQLYVHLIWYTNVSKPHFWLNNYPLCRSQWPRGLSSLAQTLRSWARIPLEAWMSVCDYSFCSVLCVQVAAFWRADPPVQGVLPTVLKIKKLKSDRGPTKRAVEL